MATAKEFLKFMPLAKVDEVTHSIYGLATSEVPDKDGEIADYAECKISFQEWSKEFLDATTAAGQDISLGNIRMQHSLEIAGKVTAIEYREEQKQIWINTKPISDEIFNLAKEGFIVGFSIAGKYKWRKEEGQYVRYAPSIAETSYVDNPCNPEAHFAYVKADGSTEIRKFQAKGKEAMSTPAITKTEPSAVQLTLTEADTDAIAAKIGAKISEANAAGAAKEAAKTKRMAGEDLPSSHFAYVGDETKTATWKLPIKFSTEAKTVRHIRNALARFESTKGIPDSEKKAVKAKIVAAAKEHGIQVSEEGKSAAMASEVFIAIQFLRDDGVPKTLRESAIESVKSYTPELTAETIAEDARKALRVFKQLRPADFSKSLWDVASVADVLNTLSWTHWGLQWEKEMEDDNSDVPDNLADVIRDLVFVFQQLATEESNELVEALRGQDQIEEGVGKTMKIDDKDLAKAHSAVQKMEMIKKAATDHYEAHGSPASGMHKAAMDEIHGHCDKAMGALKAVIGGDVAKAATVSEHIEKAKECADGYCGKVKKAMDSHMEDMGEKCAAAMKCLGTEEMATGDVSGPGSSAGKAAAATASAEDLQKAQLAAFQKMLTDTLAPVQKSLEGIDARLKVVEETPAPTAAKANIFAVNRPGSDNANKNTGSVFDKVDPAATPGSDMPSFASLAKSVGSN